jgi:ankyrin repeat protein
MMAAAKGYTDIVKFLLEQGADPNIKNNQNKTAEQIAQENDHNDLAMELRKVAAFTPVERQLYTASSLPAFDRVINELLGQGLSLDGT